jgi:ABC-type bacteriocin/lantibiotic exporter with double-glycine peptidase domain
MMLDEATSALDPECEKIVCASLAKVMKGRTQIIVTHRLTTIREADQIIVIE